MGGPATVDSGLARSISAYRAGHLAPAPTAAGPSGELFRSRGQSHIRSRLADGPYDQYVAVRDRARAAVSAARAGDFDGSERLFADAETFLSSLALSGEPLHLSRSWIDQAYAYL